MQPQIASVKRRGPPPKSSWMDALLCYLIWARSASQFADLAAKVQMTESRVEDNIARVRPLLNATLQATWWKERVRPEPLVGTDFPHVAVLIDSTTIQVFRPKAPFEEAKIYWDGKNKLYGVKAEVVVTAMKPHYCMFASRHTVGSIHDYERHKQLYSDYLPYLVKTPREVQSLPNDHPRFWAAILDKGYTGPATDTPDLRRIVPKKGQLTQGERANNEKINRIRVPVEQYLGRLNQLWGIVRGVYRWDHQNFDLDFQNACLLTNESIKRRELNEQERTWYLKYLSQRLEHQEQQEAKRTEQLHQCSERKKQRLSHYLL